MIVHSIKRTDHARTNPPVEKEGTLIRVAKLVSAMQAINPMGTSV